MGSDRPRRSERATVEAEERQSEDASAGADVNESASAADGTGATTDAVGADDTSAADAAAESSEAGVAGKAHDGAEMPSHSSPTRTDERTRDDLARSVRDLVERERSLSVWRSAVAGAAVGAVAIGLSGWWSSAICYGLGALVAGYGHSGRSKGNAVAGGAAVGVALTAELLVEIWRLGVVGDIVSDVTENGPVEIGAVLLAVAAIYAIVLFVTSSFGGVIGLFGGALASVGDDGDGPGPSSETEVAGGFDRRK